jgi:16S rRNA processing protein RimM
VRGVHGLRGAVRVEVLTDTPEERYAPGAVLYREGSDAPLTIASAEPVADGPGWRLRFREVPDRNAADKLRGAYLEAVAFPERDLARGEYYWHEIVGAAVRGVDGAELGTVRDVYRVAETEVFEVAGGPFGTFELPAVRAFIRVFAPRRGEIVVDADALDLRAPRDRGPADERPRGPRRRSGRAKAAQANRET